MERERFAAPDVRLVRGAMYGLSSLADPRLSPIADVVNCGWLFSPVADPRRGVEGVRVSFRLGMNAIATSP